MAYHKLTLIGKLVGDPRVNDLGNGRRVAKFGLPVNYTRPKKNPETGEWEGDSFIIDVDCFDRENGRQLADVVMRFLKKGSQVYVEGRLRMNEFTTKDGVKVSKPVLVADVLELLDRPGDVGEGGTQQAPARSANVSGQRAPAAAPRGGQSRPSAPPRSGPVYDDEPDLPASGETDSDIPF